MHREGPGKRLRITRSGFELRGTVAAYEVFGFLGGMWFEIPSF